MRKGTWTKEEDSILTHFVSIHGQAHWNSLALSAGLKRSGKSCRLRWMNYLRPGVRRGNISLHEQFLILHLHSLYGNRWSKIAQHLPGRTDNDIKNYWRTRVQKQAKQLNCHVNSQQFRDAMHHLLLPRLVQQIHQSPSSSSSFSQEYYSTMTTNPIMITSSTTTNYTSTDDDDDDDQVVMNLQTEPSNLVPAANASAIFLESDEPSTVLQAPVLNHEQVFGSSNRDGLVIMDQNPKWEAAAGPFEFDMQMLYSFEASDPYSLSGCGEEYWSNIWSEINCDAH